MFGGIGLGAERIGFAALEFPKTATFLMIALLILIGFSLPRVAFDDDIHRVFLSDSALSQAQRAHAAEQSPPSGTVLKAVAAISAELDRTLPATLSAHITGEDVISAEIVSGWKGDLVALNLWGALIVASAAFVLPRDLRMALLAVLPALIGAAGVLSLSVWLGYPLTVLSNVIPILLLVLGVADGVHLAGHLKERGNLRDAVSTVGPACALTALTTTAAFASIMLTGNAQMFEFALLGAIGPGRHINGTTDFDDKRREKPFIAAISLTFPDRLRSDPQESRVLSRNAERHLPRRDLRAIHAR